MRHEFTSHKNNCCQVFSRSRNDQPLFVNEYKVGWQSSSLKKERYLDFAEQNINLFSVSPNHTLTHLSCSPKFPRASITRYTHAKTAKYEKILKFRWAFGGQPRPVIARVLDKNAVSGQTTKRCRQQKNFDSESKETWSYNHVTFTPIAKTLMLYCRLIYMLSMLYVRLKIKEKVGMPESVKVGWCPHKITGSSHVTLQRRRRQWKHHWKMKMCCLSNFIASISNRSIRQM